MFIPSCDLGFVSLLSALLSGVCQISAISQISKQLPANNKGSLNIMFLKNSGGTRNWIS